MTFITVDPSCAYQISGQVARHKHRTVSPNMQPQVPPSQSQIMRFASLGCNVCDNNIRQCTQALLLLSFSTLTRLWLEWRTNRATEAKLLDPCLRGV